MNLKFIPRPGALRYQDVETGEWLYANPHDVLYSTVTMFATEYWTTDHGWVKIFEEDDSGDVSCLA